MASLGVVDAFDRLDGINQTVAGTEVETGIEAGGGGIIHVDGGLLQEAIELVDRQVGIHFEHQGGHRRGVGRGG